jgi:hypothetical protein
MGFRAEMDDPYGGSSSRLQTGRIAAELLYHFAQLYPVYRFPLCSSWKDYRNREGQKHPSKPPLSGPV